MTPQNRIQAMKNLGVDVTPEMEEREYRISLDTVERTYGADWEATADALREQVETLDIMDWMPEAEEVAFQEYKAKRKAETAEAVAQMKAGTFKVHPLYSYESHPCTMPDDNGRIYEGLE
jgi:hypothetical protein